MKIFYDKQGNVVGFVDGATDDIESGISMKGATEATVPDDIADRIVDPFDPLTHQDITIDQQS